MLGLQAHNPDFYNKVTLFMKNIVRKFALIRVKVEV